MHEKSMNRSETKSSNFQPQEEFLRQVLFMRDDDKILAIFPFYHEISDAEYATVVGNFFDDLSEAPPKNEFCLMHETEFGWGWIHNRMLDHLELAQEDEYHEFKNTLIFNNVIKNTFILNEE